MKEPSRARVTNVITLELVAVNKAEYNFLSLWYSHNGIE
jgi:hypothetical protein